LAALRRVFLVNLVTVTSASLDDHCQFRRE